MEGVYVGKVSWEDGQMSESEDFYEKIIYENEAKAYQLRLVCNNFKGKDYIHLRKYFLSYEGNYLPSSEGISMEAGLANIYALLDALLDIVSHEEALEAVNTYFSDRIIGLKEPII